MTRYEFMMNDANHYTENAKECYNKLSNSKVLEIAVNGWQKMSYNIKEEMGNLTLAQASSNTYLGD